MNAHVLLRLHLLNFDLVNLLPYIFQLETDKIDADLIEFRFLLIEACSTISDTQLKVSHAVTNFL